jgi:putative CocE/NonD family hydrolase
LTSISVAQSSVRLKVQIAGTDAGENVATLWPDGSFESKTTLAIGTVKVQSDLKGRTGKDGRLVEYTAEQVHSTTGTSKLVLKGGKITATYKGKPESIPFDFKGKALFGNLHPQITASMLLPLKWEPGKLQKVDAFLPEAGGEVPITVTPKEEKVTGAGTVRLYHLDVPTTQVDIAMTKAGVIVGEDVPSQKLRFVADGWDEVFGDPIAKYPELSPVTYSSVVETAVPMRTRDGVTLVTDVARPVAEGRFPTILIRTPYGRWSEVLGVQKFVQRGYVVVVQDCRGRNDSGGVWDPFVHEERDGYDAIDWIVKQPWSDGKVGMIGASYAGAVQWAAAVTKHPALKCIVPQVSPPDAMRNLPYDHGIFYLFGNLWWGRIVNGKQTDLAAMTRGLDHLERLETLPLSKVDNAALGRNLTFWDRWLERDRLSAWKGFDYTWRLGTVDIPALHISGWWDGDGIGTKLNWEAMRAAGRKNQWLIYGPWGHAFNTTRRLGDIDYGEKAILELDSLYIRWFDTWLKGKEVGLEKVPRVQAFVTGANRWIPLPDWPSPSAPVKTMYLASGGRLTDRPIAGDRPSRYTYDPKKDKVTLANAGLAAVATTRIDSFVSRKDYLIFRSAPLTSPMAVTGPFEVSLSFRTTAHDTDLFAVLLDVSPYGEMRAIGQVGKLRASYLRGMDRPRPLTPNRTYVAKVLPWDSAHELKKGHRLGILVMSSMFPYYARNLGTGEPIKNATRSVLQRNTILHDAKNVSTVKFRVLW